MLTEELQNLINTDSEINNDFYVTLETGKLPIKSSPMRIDYGLVCLCKAGEAHIEIDLRSYTIHSQDIMVVFPGQILAQNNCSENFKLACFAYSDTLIQEIIYRFPSSFIGFLKERAVYSLPAEESQDIFTEYFNSLYRKFADTTNVCRREMILNILRNFYLDLYDKVMKTNDINARQRKRKTELFEAFYKLVPIYYAQSRAVAFYAEKLCITPKYLSIITQEIAGSSAKELIDKYTVTEIKLLLKSTNTPLKTVAEQLNFPSEAFLCKYFKRYGGVTPAHYRNSNH